MEKELKLVYLYNSGILISYDNHSVLIDGVFQKKNNGFDDMPATYENALLNRKPPFHGVDALLFTHCHMDHYGHEPVGEYIERYPKTLLISPDHHSDETGSAECGAFRISWCETGHIPTGKKEGPHFVFEIRVLDKQFILSGDMDPMRLDMILEKYGYDADAFFINPAMLLYELKNPEKSLLRSVQNLYIHHIPSEAQDRYGYRRMTVSSLERSRYHFGNVTLLLENMREI